MRESFYVKVNRSLSWKRVISFNLVVLLTITITLSVRLTQQSADNRSNAANEINPSATPVPNYPREAPVIERVSLFFGKPGDTVVILGKNFGSFPWDQSHLFIGNKKVTKKEIVRWSDKIIEAVIPEGATTGRVWINIKGKQAVWAGTLLVIDPSRSSRVGLKKIAQDKAVLWLDPRKAWKEVRLVLGYSGSQVRLEPALGLEMKAEKRTRDDFGEKVEVVLKPTSGGREGKEVSLLRLQQVVGQVEILRVELKDRLGRLIEVMADPLEVKVSF